MRAILLISITAYCAVTALRRPDFGMLAYICFSIFAPHSLTWGMVRSFPHVQLIAICTLLGYVWSPRQKHFPRQRESALLLALWGVFCFSTLVAFSIEDAVTRLIYISKMFLMVFLSLSLLDSEHKIHVLLKVISLSIGFWSLKVGLFVLRTGGQGAIFGPDASFLEANNSLGMACAINVPLLFYLSKMEERTSLRWLMRAMLFLSYPAVVGTFSRGAWLALAMVSVLIILKNKYKILGTLIIVICVMTSPIWISQLLSRQIVDRYQTLENYEEDLSVQTRFWSWEFCTRVALARPLYGAGFDYYSKEAYRTFYPEFLERWPGKVWSCHSMWLTILGEHGFPGFILWVGLLSSCFLSLRRLRAVAKNHEKRTQIVYCTDMLQIAFMGFILSGTFLDIAYFEVYYFLVAAVILMKENEKARISKAPEVSLRRSVAQPAPASLVAIRHGVKGKVSPLLRI